MICIPLNRGMTALIDNADAAQAAHQWTVSGTGPFYAVRSVQLGPKRWRSVFLHREVLGLVVGDPPVDHIDGDGLNCRRKNLRVTTYAVNARNRSGANKTNLTCGHLGVSYRKDRRKYRASIKIDGVTLHLGLHVDLADAVAARLEAERRLWGVQPRRREAFPL